MRDARRGEERSFYCCFRIFEKVYFRFLSYSPFIPFFRKPEKKSLKHLKVINRKFMDLTVKKTALCRFNGQMWKGEKLWFRLMCEIRKKKKKQKNKNRNEEERGAVKKREEEENKLYTGKEHILGRGEKGEMFVYFWLNKTDQHGMD